MKGYEAEEKGASYLRERGYEILDRNFYTPFGEIDIIAKKTRVLHFVEVKSGEKFAPIYNITPKKMERIFKSIHVYLDKKDMHGHAYCVDALIVSSSTMELIENITLN